MLESNFNKSIRQEVLNLASINLKAKDKQGNFLIHKVGNEIPSELKSDTQCHDF